MPPLASPAAVRSRIDLDDEPTSAITTLGGLIRGRSLVVTEDRPVTELRRLFVEFRVPAVAVVDPAGGLRGVVTRSDVLRVTDRDACARDAMSGFVLTLPATAPIAQAAALIASEGVDQIVVTSAAGALLGMVSAIDLVRYFVRDRAP